jgi:hypothetical protein
MHRTFLLPLLLLLAGCATTPDEHIIPLNTQQTQALFARARPPQAFGLTVYSTERGPVFAGAHRLHTGQAARMPFTGVGDADAPLIGLTARSVKEIPALLDTSSRENWIILSLAPALGIVSLAGPDPFKANAAHVYDEIGGYAGLLHKVLLDKLHVENSVFHVRAATGPLGPPARWMQDPVPQAVLGLPFLRAFSYVQLDFANRSALFSATTPYGGPVEDLFLARLPLRDVRGVLGVEGTLNGEPMTFVLDTGGAFELALNDPPEPTVRRLSAGDLIFPPNVSVQSARDLGLGDIDYPRIGRGLLSRYRVTFDFRNRFIYFERPVAP